MVAIGEVAARVAISTRGLARAGIIGPHHARQLFGMGRAVRRYGFSVAGAYGAAAARAGDQTAVIDERGTSSYAEMERDTSALASGLAGLGVRDSDRVGLLCRNHRDFIAATVALAKLGADTVYLNVRSGARELEGAVDREGVSAVIVDQDLLASAAGLPRRVARIVAWNEGVSDGLRSLAALTAHRGAPPARRREGNQILLTSGTTGEPRGAHRRRSANAAALLAVVSNLPFRRGDVTHIASPLFHAWGLGHLAIAAVTRSTLVLRRQFDPEATLSLISQHKVTALVTLPVMLHRIMQLPDTISAKYDTSSLRVVAVSGSALPGDLAVAFMDRFGDVVYNLYGSTEVGWASIATPADLRASPGTAGRPPRGTVLRLLDENDRVVPARRRGRIFVGNRMLFSAYTGGGTKPVVDGLMATGDVGHCDDDGRLFVDGRDDDLIISGGEKFFPGEIEDVLVGHPGVAEACVVGAPDPEWGQRAVAYVVVHDSGGADAAELRSYLRARLTIYKVPKKIISVEQLPRNATGKVLRNRISLDRSWSDEPTATSRMDWS